MQKVVISILHITTETERWIIDTFLKEVIVLVSYILYVIWYLAPEHVFWKRKNWNIE